MKRADVEKAALELGELVTPAARHRETVAEIIRQVNKALEEAATLITVTTGAQADRIRALKVKD